MRRALVVVALSSVVAVTVGAGGRRHDGVSDLVARMTLAEKAGQLAMIHVGVVRSDAQFADVLARDQVGAILSGAGETPTADASPSGWAKGVNALQRYALAH